MLADVAMALGMLAVLSVALVMAAGRHNRAASRFQQQRAAAQQADAALINLRINRQPAPVSNDGMSVEVEAVEGDAPDGYRWARATVTDGEVIGSVIGLIPETVKLPDAAAPKGGAP